FRGERVGRNPWHSNSLEWFAPSPPPHGNFDVTPVVYRGPYEYGAIDVPEDYLPQTTKVEGQFPTPQPVGHGEIEDLSSSLQGASYECRSTMDAAGLPPVSPRGACGGAGR